MAEQPKSLHFAPLGSHGVLAALEGDKLHLVIPIDAANRKAARVSSTGKTKVLASTGGFAMVPGGSGVKLNVVATVPTDTDSA